ncbi:ABC transporter substrate-binding protein [Corynebacterium provencense]|uniref:ABC transporter substrate-binding protein n=1 Tax=Corynebacterium provencense TaxID=1737425 RepID=UPI000836B936|nr:ABC transporter substrate-binding protein [Corynebacterium provencense]
MNHISSIVSTVAAAAVAVTLASCSDSGSGTTEVRNCGATVSFDHVPENVTLLKSAAVPTLQHLGVLDRVHAKAGVFPTGYYDDATNSALAAVPSITDKLNPEGHVQVSREEVVATGADLVLGATDTVNAQTLASSHIPLIEEPAFCGALDEPANWDDVWDQIRLYGTVFDRGQDADSYISELQERLESLPGPAEGAPRPRVAVLYPTPGGGTTYAYGAGSMATPVVEKAGGENVFADSADRVFEVSAEEIVDRNPDVVIALHSAESGPDDGDAMVAAVTALPGMDRTTAGQGHRIMPLMLNYAEPPTPLAVDGVEKVAGFLRDGSATGPSTEAEAPGDAG